MNTTDSAMSSSTSARIDGLPFEASSTLRYATRLTAVLAVVSAVVLPLLPSLTEASMSQRQQLAQAAVDRVAAGGGMLWLDDDETSAATMAE